MYDHFTDWPMRLRLLATVQKSSMKYFLYIKIRLVMDRVMTQIQKNYSWFCEMSINTFSNIKNGEKKRNISIKYWLGYRVVQENVFDEQNSKNRYAFEKFWTVLNPADGNGHIFNSKFWRISCTGFHFTFNYLK